MHGKARAFEEFDRIFCFRRETSSTSKKLKNGEIYMRYKKNSRT